MTSYFHWFLLLFGAISPPLVHSGRIRRSLLNLPSVIPLPESTQTTSFFSVQSTSSARSYRIDAVQPQAYGSHFTFNDGKVALKQGSVLDYETTRSVSLNLAVYEGGSWSTGTLTINVKDVNEAPVWTQTEYSLVLKEAKANTEMWDSSGKVSDPEGKPISIALLSRNDFTNDYVKVEGGKLFWKKDFDPQAKSWDVNTVQILAQDGSEMSQTSIKVTMWNSDNTALNNEQVDKFIDEKNGKKEEEKSDSPALSYEALLMAVVMCLTTA